MALTFTERLAALGMRPRSGPSATQTTTPLPQTRSSCSRPSKTASAGPGTLDDAAIATLEWVDCLDNRRLHTELGNIPPAEHEATYYRQITPPASLGTREPRLH